MLVFEASVTVFSSKIDSGSNFSNSGDIVDFGRIALVTGVLSGTDFSVTTSLVES